LFLESISGASDDHQSKEERQSITTNEEDKEQKINSSNGKNKINYFFKYFFGI
jgi:hypothetical protein